MGKEKRVFRPKQVAYAEKQQHAEGSSGQSKS